jgi:putative ABC transport system permease protein
MYGIGRLAPGATVERAVAELSIIARNEELKNGRPALLAIAGTAVAALDPEVRIDGVSTMEEAVGRAFAPWRFSSIVVSMFGAIALTFAAVGIATLVAFAVTQRTREIGVRVALGAQTRDIIVLVASEGAWMDALIPSWP